MLLDQFGPEQLERYETYRRSGLPNASIRRVSELALASSRLPYLLIAMLTIFTARQPRLATVMHAEHHISSKRSIQSLRRRDCRNG